MAGSMSARSVLTIEERLRLLKDLERELEDDEISAGSAAELDGLGPKPLPRSGSLSSIGSGIGILGAGSLSRPGSASRLPPIDLAADRPSSRSSAGKPPVGSSSSAMIAAAAAATVTPTPAPMATRAVAPRSGVSAASSGSDAAVVRSAAAAGAPVVASASELRALAPVLHAVGAVGNSLRIGAPFQSGASGAGSVAPGPVTGGSKKADSGSGSGGGGGPARVSSVPKVGPAGRTPTSMRAAGSVAGSTSVRRSASSGAALSTPASAESTDSAPASGPGSVSSLSAGQQSQRRTGFGRALPLAPLTGPRSAPATQLAPAPAVLGAGGKPGAGPGPTPVRAVGTPTASQRPIVRAVAAGEAAAPAPSAVPAAPGVPTPTPASDPPVAAATAAAVAASESPAWVLASATAGSSVPERMQALQLDLARLREAVAASNARVERLASARLSARPASAAASPPPPSPGVPEADASLWRDVRCLRACEFATETARQQWHSAPTTGTDRTCEPAGDVLPVAPAHVLPQLQALAAAEHAHWPIHVQRTVGRGLGVFATAPMAAGTVVGEYVGVVWELGAWLTAGRAESHYGYEIGELGLVVDARDGGNALRWVNHCCEPNMRAYTTFALGRWWVLFETLRDVAAGEELCYDYALTAEDPDDWHLQLPCACGAPKCRGKLYALAADDEESAA